MPSPTTTVHSGVGGRTSVESTKAPLALPAHNNGLPQTDTTSSNNSDGKKPKKEKKSHAPPEGHSGVHAPMELPKWRFWAIFISLMVCIFLFALDQLIVATAIPKITAEFNSLTKLSWLASGFFLTLLGFNLLYSQWMNIFPSKHVIMFAVFIFEIGSLVCGVAPSMDVLILGRALAGLGAAGLFSGGMIIIAEMTSLHNRAQYFALFGVCFAIASVIGPLLGGAFADHVSWRWCFYINLPFGGLAMASIAVFQPTRPPLGREKTYEGYSKDMFWKVVKCDWGGMIIAMGWAICFILFTQWGGVTKKWSDGSVIACIVLSAVLVPVFVLYEWFIGTDRQMFKLRLLKRRNVIGASIVCFCVFGVFMILVYYLSITYQAVYHTSATSAGVKLLPLILLQVAALIISSRIIPKIGRFKPVIICGPILLCIASGLFYTIKPTTPMANLYGYQVILGVGIGCCLQNVMISVQHELRREPWLISLGTGLTVFVGFAGRIVALSMGGSVFENMIQRHLKSSVPGITEEIVMAVVNDATAVWTYVPDEMRPAVLQAYTKTLSQVYIIGLPLAVIALAGALILKNDKIATKEEEEAAKQSAKEKEALEAEKEEEIAVGTAHAGDASAAVESSVPEGVQNGEREVDGAAVLAEKEGRSAV
ncbi:aflatoxin efflux pump AFLT [Kwoniella mangroviensis CBS 8886]|nr:aflatoxin efflux pump AFLT [Kwoniella mangroviensis CBS 8886]